MFYHTGEEILAGDKIFFKGPRIQAPGVVYSVGEAHAARCVHIELGVPYRAFSTYHELNPYAFEACIDFLSFIERAEPEEEVCLDLSVLGM